MTTPQNKFIINDNIQELSLSIVLHNYFSCM